MGRFADLCGTIAAESDERPDGLYLPPEAWSRLRGEQWTNADIEDALGIVRDSLLQGELIEAADSLSARMVELLGGFMKHGPFDNIATNGANFSIEVIAQLTRRIQRLEEILEIYREGTAVERSGFDELRRRLGDLGIENAMRGATAERDDEDG